MGPKVRKAARGKHRWIGLRFPRWISKREELEELLSSRLGVGVLRKLLDFGDPVPLTCIIKVGLSDYPAARAELAKGPDSEVESLTSSGKLRSVRLRLADLL